MCYADRVGLNRRTHDRCLSTLNWRQTETDEEEDKWSPEDREGGDHIENNYYSRHLTTDLLGIVSRCSAIARPTMTTWVARCFFDWFIPEHFSRGGRNIFRQRKIVSDPHIPDDPFHGKRGFGWFLSIQFAILDLVCFCGSLISRVHSDSFPDPW